MGQKIRPDSYRLGIVHPWNARWFSRGSFKRLLQEDEIIRNVIYKRIATAGIAHIDIERTQNACRIFIRAARPGLIIGRGGQGITDLTKAIESSLKHFYHKEKITVKPVALNLNIEELKRSSVAAANIAQNMAWDLEKRLPFRRTMKKAIDSVMQNREVKGVKIKLSGRLDGGEIARREWLAKGKLPLQTLRAHIDYGEATAFTTYGTIGIKVWIHKGEAV